MKLTLKTLLLISIFLVAVTVPACNSGIEPNKAEKDSTKKPGVAPDDAIVPSKNPATETKNGN